MAVDKVFQPGPGRIFVFGSNEAGIHGAGAALTAYHDYGAKWHQAEGLQGNSYAIPTKDQTIRHSLSLEKIGIYVARFLSFARTHTGLYFFVTRIGCGLAGYNDEDIAPLFQGAPPNCELPEGWR